MLELTKYDAACAAVAAVRSVDEVHEILNVAEAQRAYARMAKNRDLEADALEIRLRAERRLGEMMKAQKEAVGFAPPGRPKKNGSVSDPISKPPTLAEAGIDKHLAHRARTAAAVPQERFEEVVKEGRERITATSDHVTAKLIEAEAEPQPAKPKKKPKTELPAQPVQPVTAVPAAPDWAAGKTETTVAEPGLPFYYDPKPLRTLDVETSPPPAREKGPTASDTDETAVSLRVPRNPQKLAAFLIRKWPRADLEALHGALGVHLHHLN